MKLFTIWDLDNCLADDGWRQDKIDWSKSGDDRYREYNAHLIHDAPAHLREFELFVRKLGTTPVFFTGRSEYLRRPTQEWIAQRLGHLLTVPHPEIFMRANNSKLTPAELKERMLTEFFHTHMGFGNRIYAAFDDLPSVVKMYRDHNIPSVELAIHADLTKAYQPSDL